MALKEHSGKLAVLVKRCQTVSWSSLGVSIPFYSNVCCSILFQILVLVMSCRCQEVRFILILSLVLILDSFLFCRSPSPSIKTLIYSILFHSSLSYSILFYPYLLYATLFCSTFCLLFFSFKLLFFVSLLFHFYFHFCVYSYSCFYSIPCWSFLFYPILFYPILFCSNFILLPFCPDCALI